MLIANDPEGTVPTSTRNLTRHLAVLDHSPPPGSFEEPTRSPLKIQRLRQWERPAAPPRASAPTSKAFVTATPPEEPPAPGVPPRQRPKWPGPAPLAELPDFLSQSAASWASSPGQLVAPPGRDHSSRPALIVPQPPSEDSEPPALPPLPPAEPPPLHPIGDLQTGPLPPVPESSAPSPPWPPPAAPAARPPPATQGTPLWNSPRQRVRTTQKIDDTQQTNFMNMMLERVSFDVHLKLQCLGV
ncbi:hypothetical protein AAVH_22661 [Aphelenchoides avenae]|nr:hypothetical protein AAVH_22661 [Aphelenchus avenae]